MIDFFCILQVALLNWFYSVNLMNIRLIAQKTSVGRKSTVCPSLIKIIIELSH